MQPRVWSEVSGVMLDAFRRCNYCCRVLLSVSNVARFSIVHGLSIRRYVPGHSNPLKIRRLSRLRLRRLITSRRQNSFPRRDIYVRASSDFQRNWLSYFH